MVRNGALSASIAVIAAMLLAPTASAAYYNYGVLKAYEDGRLVAEGKGLHGIDVGQAVVGGHIGARDPRPGGSPARGRIWYQYKTSDNVSSFWHTVTGSYNYTSSWVDQAKYKSLSLGYAKIIHYAEICQVDDNAPDDCKRTGVAQQHL